MPTTIHTIARVPESELQDLITDLRDFDHVGVVTAINDGQGTFTVEATVFGQAPGSGAAIVVKGKMSKFGGPKDLGVKPDEGLALFDQADVAANPDIFLAQQPAGTSGTARRLNPDAKYVACRWDYKVTPRDFLRTIKVKVTNPATNQSVDDARPVDWGPNVDTGRAVDLSPGVLTALGLETDRECIVEIPLPAGSVQPPVSAGTPANADLAAIDSSIFPQNMARSLAVMTTSGNTIFWVVNLLGEQIGGQSLLRHADGQTKVLLSDTTVLPIKGSDQIPATIADELNKAVESVDVSSGSPSGSPPQPGDDINDKMFKTAQKFVGHDTKNVPLTVNGTLACAWCVNEVARLALGKPISTQDGQGDGLSTADLFAVLKAHHTKLNSGNDAVPGTIIIAPSTLDVHGHVGIVGTTTGGIGATAVFSNSSKRHRFEQNYTIASFTQTFQNLQVQFFALKAGQF